MKIDRVTFTGPDESVKPEDVLRVVDEYPMLKIEWALLLSKANEGKRTRYPSLAWMEEFTKQCLPYLTSDDHEEKLYLAGHIQGHWLRTMVRGSPELPTDRPTIWPFFDRIQLNFHGEKTVVTEGFYAELQNDLNGKGFIFQMDGVNEAIYNEAQKRGILNLKPLYDTSAGQGVIPHEWRKPIHATFNGYAGGLGPANFKEELKRIEEVVGDSLIWTDCETRIRSNDDQLFDLDKCRKMLDIVAEFYPPTL